MQNYADDIIENEQKLAEIYENVGFFDVTKDNNYKNHTLLQYHVRSYNYIIDQLNNFNIQRT